MLMFKGKVESEFMCNIFSFSKSSFLGACIYGPLLKLKLKAVILIRGPLFAMFTLSKIYFLVQISGLRDSECNSML